MSGKKQKKYKLNGVVLDLSMPLSNGLIVNQETAMRMIKEFNSRERSSKLGELNHDITVFGTDLCNVSHMVEHLHLEGDKIRGTGMLVGDLVYNRAAKAKELIESGNAYLTPRMIGDSEHVDLLAIDIVPGPLPKEPIKHIK